MIASSPSCANGLQVIREDFGETMVGTVRGTPEVLRKLATRLDVIPIV
jgi:hypothetical protein